MFFKISKSSEYVDRTSRSQIVTSFCSKLLSDQISSNHSSNFFIDVNIYIPFSLFLALFEAAMYATKWPFVF